MKEIKKCPVHSTPDTRCQDCMQYLEDKIDVEKQSAKKFVTLKKLALIWMMAFILAVLFHIKMFAVIVDILTVILLIFGVYVSWLTIRDFFNENNTKD